MTKANDSLEVIWRELTAAKRVLIAFHADPDLDSLASSAALGTVLETAGKMVGYLCSTSAPDYTKWFWQQHPSVKAKARFKVDLTKYDFAPWDLLLALDTASILMISRQPDFYLPADLPVVVIDHHASNLHWGTLNYVDSEASSTAEIVDELLTTLKIKLSAPVADLLLLGIMADTGILRWKVRPQTLRRAADLIERGGRYWENVVGIDYQQSFLGGKHRGLIYRNMKLALGGRVAYASVSRAELKREGITEEYLVTGSDLLKHLKGVAVVFSLSEGLAEDKVIGSLRCEHGDLDVSRLAAKFGGGGHRQAAGFSLPKVSLAEVEKRLLAEIGKSLPGK